jgi:hypothetical protein
MSTTNDLQPKRNMKSSAPRARVRVTPGAHTRPGLPALAPRTVQPAAYRTPSINRRPRGHVVRHAIGEPPPVTLDGRPRGHVIGHAVGAPREEVMRRRFAGGCVGYIYPTVRSSRYVGGSAGWMEAW